MVYRVRYLLAALLLHPAAALAAADVPATADPSRVHAQTAAPVLAPAAPQTQQAASPPPAVEAPEGAKDIKFVLRDIRISGMDSYTAADVRPLYRKMLRHEISLEDVYALANALTVKYRNEGYILAQAVVPPQEIENGRVRLRVVEGYIAEVHIKSEDERDKRLFAPYADKIRASRPLRGQVLEKYMLLMNDIAGVTARSVLSPSKAQGASDLTIEIARKRAEGTLSTDNRGSRYVGPQQYNAAVQLNGALGYGEVLSLQASAAQDNSRGFGLSLGLPLDAEGTVLNLSYSDTRSSPGDTLTIFDIQGETRSASVAVTRSFIRTRNENLSGTLTFDVFNTSRTDNLGGPEIEDKLRVLRAGVLYRLNDSKGGANSLSGTISKGLEMFDATKAGSANTTRADGDPGFIKANFEAARLQGLTEIYSLYAAVTGQKAAETLFSSEAFGVGGAAYGSAYDSSEITGRDGIALRLELRADTAVPRLQQLQPYVFYDIGKVWDPASLDAGSRARSLASAGLGVRVLATEQLSGSFELARPLTRPVEAEHSDKTRFFGNLTLRF